MLGATHQTLATLYSNESVMNLSMLQLYGQTDSCLSAGEEMNQRSPFAVFVDAFRAASAKYFAAYSLQTLMLQNTNSTITTREPVH